MIGLLATISTREGNRATLRGHILEPWQQDGRYTAVTWCLDCGLALTVNSHPQADDLPVDGSVAYLSCSHKRDTPPIWAPQIPKLMRAIAIMPAMGADHVIPFARGGPNLIENLVPCCLDCNKRKHDDQTYSRDQRGRFGAATQDRAGA